MYHVPTEMRQSLFLGGFSGLSWCDFVVYINEGKFVERLLLDIDL